MIETLAQIKAPHFTAGIVLWDDVVVEAAPVVRFMAKAKWTRTVVRNYCSAKGWQISVVHEINRKPPHGE